MTAREGPLAGLARLRAPAPPPPPVEENCELCGVRVPPEHSHVADLERRGVLCACRGCYLLFTHPGAAQGRFKAIPDRYLHDPAPDLTAAQWAELQIPVRVAFLFRNAALETYVCVYPSPGGSVEADIPQHTWADVLAANPALADTEPDVEAVLVWQRSPGPSAGGQAAGEVGFEAFVVPIDVCYQLVGVVRTRWKDTGGSGVWSEIDAFLDRLRTRGERRPGVGGQR